MLLGSFYSGLSGLQANATALNVVGNNLANINTAGFKRSQVNFGQIMSDTVSGISGGGNPIQIGLGVGAAEIVAKFEQGSIQTTGIKSHLAIQGEGFFQVNSGGASTFTRSGNFSFNEEGFLVAANGGRVQGWLGRDADGNVDTSRGVDDIKIDLGQASPPQESSLVRFISNLSAQAADDEDYSTSIEVFDSKGVAHQMTIRFSRDEAGDVANTTTRWQYTFEFEDAASVVIQLSDGTLATSGTLDFDPEGNLLNIDGENINGVGFSEPAILINGVTSGADSMSITWDAVDTETDPNVPRSFVTNYSNNFNTGTLFQDGYGSGILQDIDFNQEGTMIGFFDNGLTLQLGRVAIATFNNRIGLKQIDGGYYTSSAASGPASLDGEGTGGRGSIIASSLESSNVDIAEEFTSLIIHQRGYQSNSKTITTTDQLLQEALNLKR
jgi:flagellar hook protein FlgE